MNSIMWLKAGSIIITHKVASQTGCPEGGTPTGLQVREKIYQTAYKAAHHGRLPVPSPDEHLHRMANKIAKHIQHAMRRGRVLNRFRDSIVSFDKLRGTAVRANDGDGLQGCFQRSTANRAFDLRRYCHQNRSLSGRRASLPLGS
ncbi:MAG: hypothetical protein LC730_05570 [Acidobacteria bacterium]|nr:hypothetical protein [Acidobacteriota bacterium]